MSYEVPSQEDVKKEQSFNNVAMEAGNYIAKIGKIILKLRPGWNNNSKSWDYSNMSWVYEIVALPNSMESGDTLKDVNGKEVEPLTNWIIREFNPFALGTLPDNATPTFTRAFLAFMSGTSTSEKLSPPGFVLFSADNKLVEDEKIREQFVAELKLPLDERTLIKEGYKHCPDLRSFAGKYIGVCLEVGEKGYNKLSKFNRLPQSFVQPTEDPEVLKKFEEGYKKFMEKRAQKNQSSADTSNASTEADVGEVKDTQVAF